MSLPPLSPFELLQAIVYVGIAGVVCVYLPVQLVAKIRRMRRNNRNLTCRICGYRFLRREREAICPHCGARNR